jgi:ABC-type branched-subunit amino acid transport system substrate-binding protein
MNNRRGPRRLLLLMSCGATALLAACASPGSSGASGASGSGTGALTFAVFNPFSGADASFGPEELAGCAPAAKAIVKAGGILQHAAISCTSNDSRGDPADAIPAAEKLIATTSGLVGVIGPSSDEASATVPLFNRAQVPMFADTGQSIFDKTTNKYFYRITAPDDANGYAMALYAHQRGLTRAAFVFGTDISSQGARATAIKAFRKLGGTVVADEQLSLDQPSYRTEVRQVTAAKPDVIFTEADPQTSATFLAELKQLGHLVPFIGTGGTIQPPWLKAVSGAIGSASMATYYTAAQPYAPTSGAAYQAYLTALKADASQVAAPASQWYTDPYAMACWDSVNIMALAMEEAKSTSPAVFNPFIAKVTAASPGAVKVNTFAAGKQALLAGKKIQYVGAVGPIVFDAYHNSPGGFEIVKPDGTAITTFSPAAIAAVK